MKSIISIVLRKTIPAQYPTQMVPCARSIIDEPTSNPIMATVKAS
jgi:hypothetical protein